MPNFTVQLIKCINAQLHIITYLENTDMDDGDLLLYD